VDTSPKGTVVSAYGLKTRLVCSGIDKRKNLIKMVLVAVGSDDEGRLLMLLPSVHQGVPTKGSSNRLFCFLRNRTPHDSKTSAWGRGRKGLDGMRKLGGSS